MPFVQGQLRGEPVSITITTQCACCSQAITMEIDDQLSCRVVEGGLPLLSVPLVDVRKVKEPNIIGVF